MCSASMHRFPTLLWMCLAMAGLREAMAGPSKRKASSSSDESWGDFALGLHASNQLPGSVCKKNILKARKAGAKGLALKGKKGKQNAARTLRRAYKKTLWPSLYWAHIPMHCPKTKQTILVLHAFQLPHEWLATYLADHRAVKACSPPAGSKVGDALKIILSKLGVPWPARGHVPLGLHGDAVPIQGTMRKQSLDFLTINLPSSSLRCDLRVPFTVLNTKFQAKSETREAILKVLLWSLDCLKRGAYPTERHDGKPWGKYDKARALLKGALPAKGILCEVRGDWDWLNPWFNIPTYNTGWGMCWLCKAKFANFREQSAEERKASLSKAQFVSNVEGMGKTLCPVWAWPEMAPNVLILPDWLHAVDQGIGSDIAGQLLVELAQKQSGGSFEKRVGQLWEEVQSLYKEYHTEYRLVNLTPEILNRGKKSKGKATLKGPAAHVRHLIPLLPILTAKYFSMGSTHEIACHHLAKFLARSYGAMEANSLPEMAKWGHKVASQYMALEREAVRSNPETLDWRIMPKLHQYLHLVECGYPIQDFWCYADETAGGVFARLYERRGGKQVPGTHCAQMLERWQQTTPFPCVAMPA